MLFLCRDIAAAIHRMDQYGFAKMYYVVDYGQSAHFVNLKSILRQMNYEWADKIEHVRFGRISGMSTRKGTAILLEDILDEARDRAVEAMQSTQTTKIPPESYKQTGDILGLSAILINDFYRGRKANYEFSWERALRQTGSTAIALQYAHARLCNLEANCGHTLDINATSNLNAISNQDAINLMLRISAFRAVLIDSLNDVDPVHLIKYLFALRFVYSIFD